MKGLRFGRLFQRNGEERIASVGDELTGHRVPAPDTKILIVDDSRSIQAVVGRILSSHGYTTLAAYDGESAVVVAKEQRPSLILMDVVMPGMNGFQATREIRKDDDPKVAAIPVLIMSGNAQPSEELWSAKIKANGFLAKPFDDDELLYSIEQLIPPAEINAD